MDLSCDAAAVRAAIGSSEPVVLCGHSYGGMVISQAATEARNVRRLIYLCAFMPAENQSLADMDNGQLAPWITKLADGRTLPDLTRAPELFFGDCDSATRTWAIRQLRPQLPMPFLERVARPAWRRIPSTYLVCTQDRAFPPELQRTVFAARATEVVELKSSHSPFLSQPARLAEVLAASLNEAA